MARLIDLISAMDTVEALKLIPTLSSVELEKKFSSEGFEGYTALHIAALLGLDQIVQSLIDHGADVRARDGIDRTPMHYAVEACEVAESQSKVRIIRSLHHAESFLLFDTDKALDTPLHIAALYGESDWVRTLLDLGSDPSKKNEEGFIPRELVPTAQVELASLLKSKELSLTLIALRANKALPLEEQRVLIDKLPEHLLTQFVVLGERAPRLAVWCFNQAREQEEAQKLLTVVDDSSADEITETLSKVSLSSL